MLPNRKPIDQRVAAALLVLSYVLLVAVVSFGAFWIRQQFDKAEQDRCEMLVVQIQLTAAEVLTLKAANPPLPADVQSVVDDHIGQIREHVKQVCPDTSVPW